MTEGDIDIPEPDPAPTSVGQMAQLVQQLSTRQDELDTQFRDLVAQVREALTDNERRQTQPGGWVWFPPPALSTDPRTTVRAFVEFYNTTYVGTSGGKACLFPACWEQHPGLAMEIAALAFSWRAANIGKHASSRDAVQWHHQWRPGVISRLVHDWVHPDCFDGIHTPVGSPARHDRFTRADMERSDDEPVGEERR